MLGAELGERNSGRRLGRRLVAELADLLDVLRDHDEAAPPDVGEGLPIVAVHSAEEGVFAKRPRLVGAGRQERGADALAPFLRQHAHHRERAPGQARLLHDRVPRAAVDQQARARVVAQLLHVTGSAGWTVFLIRAQSAKSASVSARRIIPTASAFRASSRALARRKTVRPSGMKRCPIRISGQMSPHRAAGPPLEDRGADPAQRVGRRRDRRQRTASTAAAPNRVVDARDHEQEPLRDEPELHPLLGRDQRQHRGHHPDPDERDRRDARISSAEGSSPAAGQPEEHGDDPEQQRGADDAVDDANRPMPNRCIGRESGAMNVYSIVPSQRSHATVSVSTSKMIPRYAQITAPTAARRDLVHVTCRRRLDALADEDDRERVRDRPHEERQLPPV